MYHLLMKFHPRKTLMDKSLFSKRHYKWLAKKFARDNLEGQITLGDLIRALESENPNFNPSKFVIAATQAR